MSSARTTRPTALANRLTILLHYLSRNTSTAVVLLDPTGKLSGEVIRWPELSDGKRLAYIDAAGIDGHQAVFNPLDVSEEERNPDDIAIIVNQLIEVFPELIDGLEFTSTKRTIERKIKDGEIGRDQIRMEGGKRYILMAELIRVF